ncbi:MAG: hypothetical protein JW744_02800 [Candidatus Diapherotrites archaeon]|uniref:Uncharacterized protein n=1 Tax=Candidatus Iainarchaeum sp. TaxID=3101447 RepID=A0A938YWF8_9ARCH|nr:hypothetical protein [Candidatus Diapherotrites archaeon]
MAAEKKVQKQAQEKTAVNTLLVFATSFVLIFGAVTLLQAFLNIKGCGMIVDPIMETSHVLDVVSDSPGTIQTTFEVVFEKNYDFSARGLSAMTDGKVSRHQICMSKGDFEETPGFELVTEPNHGIIWNGQSNIIAKVTVASGIDRASLEQNIQEVFGDRNWKYDCSICEGQGQCNLIVLRMV